MNLTPNPPLFEHRFPRPYLLLHRAKPIEGQDSFQMFVPADAKGLVGTELELLLVHLREETYSLLSRAMLQHVRIASTDLLAKDPLPGFALFLVCQQALLIRDRLSAVISRARAALLVLARTPVTVAARLGIAA
jgi:hypothetical protein